MHSSTELTSDRFQILSANLNAKPTSVSAVRFTIYLALILCALMLRLRGVDFGLPYQTHPDEPFYAYCGGLIRMYQNNRIDERCGYPPGYLLMQAGLQTLSERDTTPWAEAPPARVFGRGVGVLFNLAAIVLAATLIKHLVGEPAGITALALLAIHPIVVEHARYATPDSVYAFFTLAAVMFSLPVWATPTPPDRLSLTYQSQPATKPPAIITLTLHRWAVFATLATLSALIATLMKYQAVPVLFAPSLAVLLAPRPLIQKVKLGLLLAIPVAAVGLWLLFGYDALARLPLIPGSPAGDLPNAGVSLSFVSQTDSLKQLAPQLLLQPLVLTLLLTLAAILTFGRLLHPPHQFLNVRLLLILTVTLLASAFLLFQFIFMGLRQWLPWLMLLVAAWATPIPLLVYLLQLPFKHARSQPPLMLRQAVALLPVALLLYLLLPAWTARTLTDTQRIQQPHTLQLLGEWFNQNVPAGPIVTEYTRSFLREYGYAGANDYGERVVTSLFELDLNEVREEGFLMLVAHHYASTRGGYYAYPDEPSFAAQTVLLKTISSPAGYGAEYKILYPWPIQHPSDIEFSDGITLRGYSLTYPDGSDPVLTLFWQATTPPTRNYTAFVHLTPASDLTKLAAGWDAPPYRPTTTWLDSTETLRDIRPLTLPENLPRGQYQLAIGFYDPATGQRLPITNTVPAIDDNRVFLSDIEITIP